jgi:hypothetical protein
LQDWLAPDIIWKGTVKRYLRNIEAALGELHKEMKVVPAMVAAAITFTTQKFSICKAGIDAWRIFPTVQGIMEGSGNTTEGGCLLERTQNCREGMTITEYGTAEWI